MENYFNQLNAIDVSDKIEKKNKFNYLSWAWAWAKIKELFPDATYTVYENKDGWNYHTDGRTCWVKTGVTINGIEHIEYLPIMDAYNKSIVIDKITSFEVNKAIQRSITKACARHGLGLYIYAGEDLPEDLNESKPKEQTVKPLKQAPEVVEFRHKLLTEEYPKYSLETYTEWLKKKSGVDGVTWENAPQELFEAMILYLEDKQ